MNVSHISGVDTVKETLQKLSVNHSVTAIRVSKLLLINLVIIVLITAKQPASYQCSVWHDLFTVLASTLYEN